MGEKEQILANGFGDISYRDFGCFVRSAIKHGDDLVKITEAMLNGMDFEEENEQNVKDLIARYHVLFFEKAPKIQELTVSLQRIEEGEKKRELRVQREKERLQKNEEKRIKSEEYAKKKKEGGEKKKKKKKKKS